MTPDDLKLARTEIGRLWGLGRAVRKAELGRALGFGGRDPGESIADYEAGRSAPSAQTVLLIRMFRRGDLPPDGLDIIKPG